MNLEVLFDEELNLAVVPDCADLEKSSEINMIEVGRVVVNAPKASSYVVNETELIILEQSN